MNDSDKREVVSEVLCFLGHYMQSKNIRFKNIPEILNMIHKVGMESYAYGLTQTRKDELLDSIAE